MAPGFFSSLFGRREDAEPAREPDAAAERLTAELLERQTEVSRLEEKLRGDLEAAAEERRSLDAQAAELAEERRRLARREDDLRVGERELEAEGERLSGLGREQARQELIQAVEREAERQSVLIIHRAEEEARLEGERRARGILSVAMQRLASTQSVESNTQTVHLPSEAMKGRIIGKDGRNIRTLEGLTGVDIIIDETPESVVLSSFDGVRREVARITLEKLIADGRIHPASCEAAYEEALGEVDGVMVRAAEDALLEARVNGVHPELVRLLGRLRFRTSHSQNVLAHVVECANLAAMMAAEIGASAEIARRAALLHDIGKAVSHEVEGTHAEVGARLARRYDENEIVCNAIAAHHGEVDPASVEAVIVQAADAVSGARPGARGDSLEQYVTRLGDLEDIARRQDGVKKVYAMKAGREIRVVVDPGQVDDRGAAMISHAIATAIEKEMRYPGQIKITVIREVRSSAVAR